MNVDISQVRTSLRAAMPVARKWAYFDHAAVAPLTQAASSAIGRWLVEASEEGDTRWPEWARQLGLLRHLAAQLVGAEESNIALLPNTTAGINLVAEGLDWQPGDNVVTLDDEFPSNLYPWMHLASRGVETRLVPTVRGRVTDEQIAAHCDARTRVVSVSWVGFANGFRRELRPLANVIHAHKGLFLVDAIQGLGVFPLDVQQDGIDVLSADGHKWLLGPEGAGLAYLNDQALSQLRPTGVGWNSVVQGSNFDHIELKLKQSAGRYEGGTYNMAGMIGLAASLRVLLDLRIEAISEAILDFHALAVQELRALGALFHSPEQPAHRSGILSFELPGWDPPQLRKRCLAEGVAINSRSGRVRVSAHAYNNSDDLERLLRVIRNAKPSSQTP